jgi:hypothetical protein
LERNQAKGLCVLVVSECDRLARTGEIDEFDLELPNFDMDLAPLGATFFEIRILDIFWSFVW